METLKKIVVSKVAAILCLWPLWMYLIAKWLLAPTGFWQNVVLAGLGVWALGMFQFIFLILLLFILFKIWLDD